MPAIPEPSRDIVLVVDDEQTVLRMATSALAGAGYRAVVAENGLVGLETFLEHRDRICLVLADVMMPLMGGLEMAHKIEEQSPGMSILLMSGYSDQAIPTGEGFPMIRKPFLPERLISEIRRILREAGE